MSVTFTTAEQQTLLNMVNSEKKMYAEIKEYGGAIHHPLYAILTKLDPWEQLCRYLVDLEILSEKLDNAVTEFTELELRLLLVIIENDIETLTALYRDVTNEVISYTYFTETVRKIFPDIADYQDYLRQQKELANKLDKELFRLSIKMT